MANSTDVVHAWALGGAGIAVKALWDIEEDLRDGRLVEVLEQYSGDSISLYVAFLSRKHIPYRLRQFIDLLVDSLPTKDE